jgi:hypothetical protein
VAIQRAKPTLPREQKMAGLEKRAINLYNMHRELREFLKKGTKRTLTQGMALTNFSMIFLIY